jgi:hypothetical protein
MVTITARIREQVNGTDNSPSNLFVMAMLHCRTTAHIKHWLTASRSDHQALEFFYDGIVPLIDAYVEGYQSLGEKIQPQSGYTYPSEEPLEYFQNLAALIDSLRYMSGFPTESWLQNQVDEIRLLVAQTIYQLQDLK